MLHGGGALPWFVLGVAISLVMSLVARDRVGRGLGLGPGGAWLMVLSLGIILSATLTPLREALEFGATGPTSCDLSRIGPAPLAAYLAVGDTGGNVLMFIPLGVAIGMIPRSRRKTVAILAAILLPFAIETTQLLVPALDRACESADVFDNLAGLALGLALGTGAAWLTARNRREGSDDAGSR